MAQKNLLKDSFDALLFLFFFTLHADQLSLNVGGFTLRLNNLIGLALLALLVCRVKPKALKISRGFSIILIALTLSILSSWALTPYKARCTLFLGWYSLTLLLYVYLPYLLITLLDKERVLNLYFASFVCVGLYACLQLALSFVGVHDPFVRQQITSGIARPSAFAYEPSFYALYMTPFVVWVNFTYLTERRYTLLQVVGVNALFLISTTTASFVALLIFCLLFPFFSSSWRRYSKFLLGIATAFLLLFLLSPWFAQTFFFKFFNANFLSHGSFLERWIGIKNGWHLFLSHPLFGVGLGGYPLALFEAYLQGEGQYIFLYQRALIPVVSQPLKLFEPMNVTVEYLASLGVVGLLPLIGLMAYLFKQMRGFAPWVFSVLVMLLVMQFNQGLFRTYVWVHLTFVSVLVREKSVSKEVFSPSWVWKAR